MSYCKTSKNAWAQLVDYLQTNAFSDLVVEREK